MGVGKFSKMIWGLPIEMGVECLILGLIVLKELLLI